MTKEDKIKIILVVLGVILFYGSWIGIMHRDAKEARQSNRTFPEIDGNFRVITGERGLHIISHGEHYLLNDCIVRSF